jgi:uncharacterized protein with HEPN domain
MPREGGPGADRIRVQHMLDAAREAIGFAANKSKEYYEHDRMLQLALVQCVQIIGEAAARTSDTGRSRVPGLPWSQIVGMRHILVHVYFDLDLDAVWRVVQEDLPTLVNLLGQALAQWPSDPVDAEDGRK